MFREGNCCADKLANYGHYVVDTVWLDSLPTELAQDFFGDRFGLLNYRFPYVVFVLFALLLRILVWSPLLYIF